MDVEKFADEIMKKAKVPVDRDVVVERLKQSAEKKKAKERNRVAKKEIKAAKREANERMVKEGIDFLGDKGDKVYVSVDEICGYKVGLGVYATDAKSVKGKGGVETQKAKHFIGAACFCSPRDTWSDRVAEGLIGFRLKNDPQPFTMEYDEPVDPSVASFAFWHQALLDAPSPCGNVPDSIVRKYRQGISGTIDSLAVREARLKAEDDFRNHVKEIEKQWD